MMNFSNKSTIGQAAFGWLQELGYDYAFGPEIAFDDVVLTLARLRDGLSLPRVMRKNVRVKDMEKVL